MPYAPPPTTFRRRPPTIEEQLAEIQARGERDLQAARQMPVPVYQPPPIMYGQQPDGSPDAAGQPMNSPASEPARRPADC